MNKVVLVGDSVFDNAAYIQRGERDVQAHLNAVVGENGWTVELCAVDGSVTRGVVGQLQRVREAQAVVLSSGGNDALSFAHLLTDDAPLTFPEVLIQLGHMREQFRRDYVALLDRLVALQLPTLVCTIYDPRFPEAILQQSAEAALSAFNDVIYRECRRHGLPVIDLRDVCTEASDYANPIEPSHRGGSKIADAIADWLIS